MVRILFFLIIAIIWLPELALADARAFCRVKADSNREKGLFIHTVVTVDYGESGFADKVEPYKMLPRDAIVPCDKPMTHPNLDHTFLKIDGKTKKLNGQESSTPYWTEIKPSYDLDGIERLERNEERNLKVMISLDGANGRSVKVRNEEGATSSIKVNASQYELLDSKIYVEKREAQTDDLVQIVYKVKASNGKVYWIDSTEFSPPVAEECDTSEHTPKQPPFPEPLDTSKVEGKKKGDSLLAQMGSCIPKNIKSDTFKGKVLRHHLWDNHWSNKSDFNYKGRKITPQEMYAIDSLARTVYGEMHLDACTKEGTHFSKAIAKTMMNRADYVSKHWGTGKDVTPFVKPNEIKGFDPKGKPLSETLPYVLEASWQYSPWNKVNQSQVDGLLCIKPGNDTEKQIWADSVDIAAQAILNREAIDLATQDVTQYFFTHKSQDVPDAWKNKDGSTPFSLAWDESTVDGEPIVSWRCLQRWNNPNYEKLTSAD